MSHVSDVLTSYSQSAHSAERFAEECRKLKAAASNADAPLNQAVETLRNAMSSDATDALGISLAGATSQLHDILETLETWEGAASTFAAETARLHERAYEYSRNIHDTQRTLVILEDEECATPEDTIANAHRRRALEQSIEGDSRAIHSLIGAMERQEDHFAQVLEAGQVRIGAIPPIAVCAFGTGVQNLSPFQNLEPFGDADYLWVRYVMGIAKGDAVAYDIVDAPLFPPDRDGDGIPDISSADVKQGVYGDCWFLSTVMAIAGERPELIEEMFEYNADTGMYTVWFYNENGERVPVEVDGRLALNSDGNPIGAKLGGDTEVIWPCILEKALMENPDLLGAEYLDDGYQAIEGDHPALAMRLLTGDEGIRRDWYFSFPWFDALAAHDDVITLSGLGDLISDPNNPAIAIATTHDNANLPYQLEGKHCYYIESIQDGVVTLQNPHGYSNEPIRLTEEQFTDTMKGVAWKKWPD